MGRRKRKSTYNKKAPLLFTESPVNGESKNCPSPVCCARHPPTAKAVPVDEADVSWISPQFEAVPTSIRKRRRGRGALQVVKFNSTTCTCGQIKDNVDLTSCSRPLARNKFKALKFIGDRTQEISIMEDVSCSEDENITINNERHSVIENLPVLKRKTKSAFGRKTEKSNPVEIKDGVVPSKDVDTSFNQCNYIVGSINNKTIETSLDSTFQEDGQFSFADLPSNSSRLMQPDFLVQYIDNTTVCSSPNRGGKERVLVCDTPEAEYGLKYRDRRPKHKKK